MILIRGKDITRALKISTFLGGQMAGSLKVKINSVIIHSKQKLIQLHITRSHFLVKILVKGCVQPKLRGLKICSKELSQKRFWWQRRQICCIFHFSGCPAENWTLPLRYLWATRPPLGWPGRSEWSYWYKKFWEFWVVVIIKSVLKNPRWRLFKTEKIHPLSKHLSKNILFLSLVSFCWTLPLKPLSVQFTVVDPVNFTVALVGFLVLYQHMTVDKS